jgi:hypothetical protein
MQTATLHKDAAVAMRQELVVLMPADGPTGDVPRPGIMNRLLGALGRESLVFASLAADPAHLAGVLVTSQGDPGPIRVNGVEAGPLWSRKGRMLMDPALFGRWENILAARCDVQEVRLAPVVQGVQVIDGLGLPAGTRWRMQTLEGKDLGEMSASENRQTEPESILAGLARGLSAMVARNGDVWSFYDLADQCYRLSAWRWDTGIVLEALAAAQQLGGEALLDTACVVGDRLLATRLNHAAHPDCPGGFPEWADLRYSEAHYGVSQWVAPFNAAFIAGGLMRLAEVSGRDSYRQAARDGLRLAVERGLTPAGGVSGYYFENSRQWKYLGQINDSGVLGRGLGLMAGEQWASEAADNSARYVLDKASQPDGHIARAWWDPVQAAPPGSPLFPEWKRRPGRVVPKIFLRGQAWVLMGLTGAMKLGASVGVIRGARRLAAFILDAQQPDGSWLYSGRQPQLGACVKTTAALALALAEWSAASSDPLPLPAVHKALKYLESCRSPEAVPKDLSAMPVDRSEEGCIIYFRDRPVVCAYAAALELLARLAVGERP